MKSLEIWNKELWLWAKRIVLLKAWQILLKVVEKSEFNIVLCDNFVNIFLSFICIYMPNDFIIEALLCL